MVYVARSVQWTCILVYKGVCIYVKEILLVELMRCYKHMSLGLPTQDFLCLYKK